MFFLRIPLIPACLIFSLSATADTTIYQTAPKTTETQYHEAWSAPVISIDPHSGRTRVFITPNGSFSNELASHGAPVYHARALYEPSETGIPGALLKLHRQMAEICPAGWIKLQEWASLSTNAPELHYQFQCLDTD